MSFNPRWMYHDSAAPVLVQSQEHLESLGSGWADSPYQAALIAVRLAGEGNTVRDVPGFSPVAETPAEVIAPAEIPPPTSPEPVVPFDALFPAHTLEMETSPVSGNLSSLLAEQEAPSALTNEEPPLAHASVDDVD